MYKTAREEQVSLTDFNEGWGAHIDMGNEWVAIARRIPWGELEKRYAAQFPSRTGRPAFSLRTALGALIIQKRMGLTDRGLVGAIAENPYYQYFIGLPGMVGKCPFTAPALVAFRRRLGAGFMVAANEAVLAVAAPTREHAGGKPAASGEGGNAGTAILDATCSPSNIRYPQDFVLLNTAREKLEALIDHFHGQCPAAAKPRTYRRVARREYLSLARSKRRTDKAVRRVIRKQLGYISRDLRYIDEYVAKGHAVPDKQAGVLETIRELYRQQKEMFDNRTHRVADRIVSLSQPHIRPIVRGKSKAPVEFGAKYDVSIDEKGHARLEHVSFDPYNESTIFQDMLRRYKERTGHFPARVLVDQIYRTRANRDFCRENGIRMSGPRPGRPAGGGKRKRDAGERRDNIDRIEVERFFSVGKRCNGAGLIRTRLAETTLGAIALSILVTNLFATFRGGIFLLYFWDSGENGFSRHYVEFEDAA